MKKVLIFLLVLVLALTGLFFWKGGHHALALADILEEWLEGDDWTQALTIQVQMPDHTLDPNTGRIEPVVRQLFLNADGFRTEYADRDVFGLESNGMTAYFLDGVVYMDTGRAYALPELSGLKRSARNLAWGLLLRGRVTKTEDTYHLSMKTDEAKLSASVTADRAIRGVTLSLTTGDGIAVQGTVTPKEPLPHPIPQPVRDAMVLAKIEPPMALTEPLEVLLPALEELLPLTGDLTLVLESGILKLSETVVFSMDRETAEIQRKGVAVTVPLPVQPSSLEPLPIALLLLRNGSFTQDGANAAFTLTIPAETTGALCAALVPQIGELEMTFWESQAVVTVTQGRLDCISMTTEGEVPFLFTTIPVSFSAELKIR